MIQQNFCRECGKPIDNFKRKDSIFCSEQCRKQNWELSGKRHSRIPTKASSNGLGVLKASDNINKFEVKENQKQKSEMQKTDIQEYVSKI